jgi:hypothetical protein
MRIVAYITSYNRPEMLKAVVSHLESQGVECYVYEDGVTHEFRGKQGFWKTWNEMFIHAKENKADLYIFAPDDFLNIDVEQIKQRHEQIKKHLYIYNLINDGRLMQWIRQEPKQINEDTIHVSFTDCGFFISRHTFEHLGFKMGEVSPTWFQRNGSSGVGYQLTIRAKARGIPCYTPVRSLAYHGDHESVMHPELRKKEPLISR